jgi:signal peptidase II
MKGKYLYLFILLLGVALDLGTKEAAFHYTHPEVCGHPDGAIRVVEASWFKLYWRQVENSGGMFGLGQGSGPWLRYFRLLAFLVVLVFFVTAKRTQRLFLTALALIGAGAVGNLYDSFFNGGKVRDFIEVWLPFLPWKTFNPWPNFNIADSLILIGAACLVLVLLKDAEFGKKKQCVAPAEEAKETA